MRGKPKARRGKSFLEWRSRQPEGAIMKASTFKEIEESAKEKGLSAARAAKSAGAAYWVAAKKKYKERKKK